jgi:hypothetical protein
MRLMSHLQTASIFNSSVEADIVKIVYWADFLGDEQTPSPILSRYWYVFLNMCLCLKGNWKNKLLQMSYNNRHFVLASVKDELEC